MSNAKEIPLTQGHVAIVDAADYDWLMQWKWHVEARDSTCYAVRHSRREDDKRYKPRMHRVILGVEANILVDHIDGNGLNNTRGNIRPATDQQNAFNRQIGVRNTSGYKGVTWHKQRRLWQAQIKSNGKHHHLGLFQSAEDAANAYNQASLALHGEYARLNEMVTP